MCRFPLTMTFFALFVTAGLASAQRTWIVDAANGQGTDFTDLPPAVAAAKDGDRIVVRKGIYKPTSTGKAISILGEPGAEVHVGSSDQAFRVAGVPAGKRLLIRGVSLVSRSWGEYCIVVFASTGRVDLVDVRLHAASSGTFALGIFGGRTRSAVTLNGVSQRPGGRGIQVAGCHLVANGVSARDIEARDSILSLTNCRVEGRAASVRNSPTSALTATNCQVTVRGKWSSFVGGRSSPRVAGITGTGGTLLLDPRARVDSAASGFTKITTRRTPALSAHGGKLGATVNLTLDSRAGKPFAVFGSLAAQPLAKELDLWLDLRFLHVVAVGVQDQAELWTGKIAVPDLPILLGYQAIEVDLKTPSFELSNPGFVAGH